MSYRVTVIRSRRKTAAIQIAAPGEVTLRLPLRYPQSGIPALLESHRDWIEKHMRKLETQAAEEKALPPLSAEEIRRLAEEARTYIPGQVRYYAWKMNISYGRITIRNQRTRWGSCSSKGSLSFNCLLMLCPIEVIDYIIVHELCHRKEMNHSPRFWAEVAAVLPDYKQREKWLKQHGHAILARAARE
jgi:hypothetical protein